MFLGKILVGFGLLCVQRMLVSAGSRRFFCTLMFLNALQRFSSNPVCAQNISIPEIRSSNLNFLTDIYLTCLQLLILLVSREMVASLQASLVMATHVAKTGDPDFQRMADWLKISCE